MSTSVGSKKSRKDFGFANNLAASLHSQKESVEPTVENPTIEETVPQAVEPTETIQSSMEPQVDVVDNVTAADHQEATSTVAGTITETKPNPVVRKPEVIGLTRLKSKKQNGKSKSVYFDLDIYQYIEELADKEQVYFSAVVNSMLRDYFNIKIKSTGKE